MKLILFQHVFYFRVSNFAITDGSLVYKPDRICMVGSDGDGAMTEFLCGIPSEMNSPTRVRAAATSLCWAVDDIRLMTMIYFFYKQVKLTKFKCIKA